MQPDPALPAGRKVALNWTNNATNATSVVVERAVGAGAVQRARHAGPDRHQLRRPTVVLPGAYSYRVNAVNAVGPSAYAGPVTVTVPQPASTTVVVEQPEPVRGRDSVTFTATVTPVLATAHADRNVTFTANGVTTAAPLDATGVANVTTTALPAGTSTITADYGGDAVFQPSSGSVDADGQQDRHHDRCGQQPQPVDRRPERDLHRDGQPLHGHRNRRLHHRRHARPTRRSSAGQATLSTSALAVGGHVVGASYGGDAAYLGSTSATFTQTVGPALRATTTVVTSNRVPAATLGQSITFTATVRPVTGTGIPDGTVQFTIDGVNVGGALTLNAQGRATYSTAPSRPEATTSSPPTAARRSSPEAAARRSSRSSTRPPRRRR